MWLWEDGHHIIVLAVNYGDLKCMFCFAAKMLEKEMTGGSRSWQAALDTNDEVISGRVNERSVTTLSRWLVPVRRQLGIIPMAL
jgi:hypothetical protein